jgi:hypothetical protein
MSSHLTVVCGSCIASTASLRDLLEPCPKGLLEAPAQHLEALLAQGLTQSTAVMRQWIMAM